jgi:hypothetical protein
MKIYITQTKRGDLRQRREPLREMKDTSITQRKIDDKEGSYPMG